MLFNFDLFSVIAKKAYSMVDDPLYPFDQVLDVFRYYFEVYEHHGSGSPHPPIRTEQIVSIIERMPHVDEDEVYSRATDLEAENYKELIDQHFKTRYRQCDYNINHFFSGNIRMMRMYETIY